MSGTKAIAAGALAILLVGCGGSVTAPSVSVPGATPDPETVRNTAAAAYLEAAKIANETQAAINRKYPTPTTLEAARAAYQASATMHGAFVAALKNIVVPVDMAREMDDVIARYTAVQALWIKGGDATSWAELDDLNRDLKAAIGEATGAANLVRSDLGLPPVPLD